MTQLADQRGANPSENDVYFWEPIAKDDVAAYLAFITERYPLLREALDRVAEELVKEGVDLQRLSSATSPRSTISSRTTHHETEAATRHWRPIIAPAGRLM